jgi:hypothetical protein
MDPTQHALWRRAVNADRVRVASRQLAAENPELAAAFMTPAG